ncbi:hypothetical protein [Larkinella knui]
MKGQRFDRWPFNCVGMVTTGLDKDANPDQGHNADAMVDFS